MYFHTLLGTFRSEHDDDNEYEFSVLSLRIRFGGQHFSKCACSEQKTRTRSRPRPSILRSLLSHAQIASTLSGNLQYIRPALSQYKSVSIFQNVEIYKYLFRLPSKTWYRILADRQPYIANRFKTHAYRIHAYLNWNMLSPCSYTIWHSIGHHYILRRSLS